MCAACPTPRLNQSYELRPPWEQHLRYVPHRVRNGHNTLFHVHSWCASGAEESPERKATTWAVLCRKCWRECSKIFHERFLAANKRKCCVREQNCRSTLLSSASSHLAMLHKNLPTVRLVSSAVVHPLLWTRPETTQLYSPFYGLGKDESEILKSIFECHRSRLTNCYISFRKGLVYMSYRFADSLLAGSGRNWFGSAAGGVLLQKQQN